MLTGILFDANGERLSPSHATKRTKGGGTRRYYYYVSAALIHGQSKSGIRLSAPELDALVINSLKQSLRDPSWVRAIAADDTSIRQLQRLLDQSSTLARTLNPQHARHILSKVLIDDDAISITLDDQGLAEHLRAGTNISTQGPICIHQPTSILRSGRTSKLVIGSVAINEPCINDELIYQLKTAHRWAEALFSGEQPSIASLARSERTDPSEISRTITLAFLAPNITRTILKGTQPSTLTLDALRRARPLPPSWDAQKAMLQAR